MGNIKNYNYSKLDLKLSNNNFWDFNIANDTKPFIEASGLTNGECAVVWFDFNNLSIYPNSATTATTIYSLISWDGATNSGYTFNTYGLTGLDNGNISYNKDILDNKNQTLVEALTGSTLIINSGDTRFKMSLVSGNTNTYIYPIEHNFDSTFGNYVQLCGGFYQGFYKIDGSTYEVLPVRVNQAWSAEFWLKPQDSCSTTGLTLNDTYPDNKGFFFYMGTRAENKFWNQFDGNNSGCTSACTTTSACTGSVTSFCTVLKEKDITIIGDYGFGIPLNPPQVEIDLITNPFLIYGRAYNNSPHRLTGITGTILNEPINNIPNKPSPNTTLASYNGLGSNTIYTYNGGGISIANSKEIKSDFTNPFLIYGRALNKVSGCTCGCCGVDDGYGNQTLCTYSGDTKLQTEIDYNLDIFDNALGFRITDDGRIGYRLLTITGECKTINNERIYQSGLTIQEEYSEINIVKQNEWSYIVIRYVTNYLDGCDFEYAKPRNGKLMFYVNAKLKFVVDEFPEFIARRLDEHKTKQIGVPFNFSLGGGTQGLIESQTFDGPDNNDKNLPIEKYFAGTFIGGIADFKFNICDLKFSNIEHNFNI